MLGTACCPKYESIRREYLVILDMVSGIPKETLSKDQFKETTASKNKPSSSVLLIN